MIYFKMKILMLSNLFYSHSYYSLSSRILYDNNLNHSIEYLKAILFLLNSIINHFNFKEWFLMNSSLF